MRGGREQSKKGKERKKGLSPSSSICLVLSHWFLWPRIRSASTAVIPAGRVHLAGIQSRSFYQPPEVDLTPMFLDGKKHLIIQPVSPFPPPLLSLSSSPLPSTAALRCAVWAHSDTERMQRGRSKSLYVWTVQHIHVCMCSLGWIYLSD